MKSPKLKTGRESLLQAKSPLKVSGIQFIAPDRVLGYVKLCIEGLLKFEGFFLIRTFLLGLFSLGLFKLGLVTLGFFKLGLFS